MGTGASLGKAVSTVGVSTFGVSTSVYIHSIREVSSCTCKAETQGITIS